MAITYMLAHVSAVRLYTLIVAISAPDFARHKAKPIKQNTYYGKCSADDNDIK